MHAVLHWFCADFEQVLEPDGFILMPRLWRACSCSRHFLRSVDEVAP